MSFANINNIKHKLTPYHLETNGQAERFVQTFKNYFKATVASTSQRSISPQKLDSFLFAYRTTPHATSSATPAELLLGRRSWTTFDMLHPKTVHDHVLHSQEKMVTSKESPTFGVHQEVWTRSYESSNTRWLPATIVETLGRHVDQLRSQCRLLESFTQKLRKSKSSYTEDVWDGVWVDSENSNAPTGVACASGWGVLMPLTLVSQP
ncbi:uncharacterized protein K02A2.6-like [Pelobates cultripes]|uniref:Uncharacterized protein K02A2.6-like n=1 Tax=Pelobates cultripes TaxID=61616 RepID=A0AAD1WFM2_PELCU|nr:uncharacterized protein K02A2.6-like [Pelobates cultripes]